IYKSLSASTSCRRFAFKRSIFLWDRQDIYFNRLHFIKCKDFFLYLCLILSFFYIKSIDILLLRKRRFFCNSTFHFRSYFYFFFFCHKIILVILRIQYFLSDFLLQGTGNLKRLADLDFSKIPIPVEVNF